MELKKEDRARLEKDLKRMDEIHHARYVAKFKKYLDKDKERSVIAKEVNKLDGEMRHFVNAHRKTAVKKPVVKRDVSESEESDDSSDDNDEQIK